MTIFITGGAGYIGSHILIELIKQGYDIVIADNFSNSSPKIIERIKHLTGSNLLSYNMDLQDEKKLNMIFASHKFEAVIHLAGLKVVNKSTAVPLKYYSNNVGSTLSLCRVMQKHDVKKIIFSSSATVYSSNNTMPLTESSSVGNCTNPYGWTKLMCEQILQDVVSANNDWSLVILRYFNPIGAHKSGKIGENPLGVPSNLMPYIAQTAIGLRENISVFGNNYDTPDGTCIRDYIHITDLAKAHIAAIKYVKSHAGSNIFNIGTGKGTSVLELINTFERTSGITISKKIVERRNGDLPICYTNTQKANQELGWATKKTIEEACEDSWRWQKMNPYGI